LSASAILATIADGWNRRPSGVALGTGRTGVSAALWARSTEDVYEVGLEPSDVHIVSINLSAFQVEFTVDGRSALVGDVHAGDITIVPAGSRPRAVQRGPWSLLQLYVPKDLLNAVQDEPSATPVELVTFGRFRDREIERIGREVLAEMRASLPLSRLRIDVLGQDLAIQLLRRHSNLAGSRELARDTASGGLAPYQVRRVCDHIQAHMDKDLGLSDLAAMVDLSPHHFCRAFKQSTGLPPHKWLTTRRIARAQEMMLVHPAMSLVEIALCVGYENQSAFGVAFRKATGSSPSAWRRARLS